MPRLSQNPELRRAAQLAKVGPETWESWKNAAEVPLALLKSFMADSVVGDLLRSAGVEMPEKSGDLKTLEQNILDFGIPQLPVGQIKRLKHALRKNEPGADRLRKVMAKELGLRGKADQEDYIDQVLRSTPFHGRGYEHYPNTGEVYNPGIPKPGNIGEPQGLSVTYRDPKKFVREHTSFAKSPKKYENVLKTHRTAYAKLQAPLQEIDKIIIDLDKKAASVRKSDLTKNEKLAELSRIDTQRDNLFSLRELSYPKENMKSLNRAEGKLSDKLNQAPPMARVFPRFHGKPTERVVKGWKGSGDEKVLQDAYTYALHQMPELWNRTNYTKEMLQEALPKSFTQVDLDIAEKAVNNIAEDPGLLRVGELALEGFKKGEPPPEAMAEVIRKKFSPMLSGALLAAGGPELSDFHTRQVAKLADMIGFVKTTKDLVGRKLPSYSRLKQNMSGAGRQKFNTHLTDYLRAQGYRGVLYSPMRYNEWELRMLDPRDVVQQDIRQADDPALKRMYGKSQTKLDKELQDVLGDMHTAYMKKLQYDYTDDEYQKLASEYKKLGTKADILKEIIKGNLSEPRKPKALKSWKEISDYQANPWQDSGHQPYALGAIYGDIDLPNLEYLDDTVRKAQAQEVKARLLAQEEQTLADGLQVGRLGDRRIRQDDVPDFDPTFAKGPEPTPATLAKVSKYLNVPMEQSKLSSFVSDKEMLNLLKAAQNGEDAAAQMLEKSFMYGDSLTLNEANKISDYVGTAKKPEFPWEDDLDMGEELTSLLESGIDPNLFANPELVSGKLMPTVDTIKEAFGVLGEDLTNAAVTSMITDKSLYGLAQAAKHGNEKAKSLLDKALTKGHSISLTEADLMDALAKPYFEHYMKKTLPNYGDFPEDSLDFGTTNLADTLESMPTLKIKTKPKKKIQLGTGK